MYRSVEAPIGWGLIRLPRYVHRFSRRHIPKISRTHWWVHSSILGTAGPRRAQQHRAGNLKTRLVPTKILQARDRITTIQLTDQQEGSICSLRPAVVPQVQQRIWSPQRSISLHLPLPMWSSTTTCLAVPWVRSTSMFGTPHWAGPTAWPPSRGNSMQQVLIPG